MWREATTLGDSAMHTQQYTRALLGVAILAISGCAITPTTDVRSMDPKFVDETRKEKIGIVKFDIYTTDPNDAAGGAAAGAGGGLIGAFVYLAIKEAQNNKDYSVDSEAVRLHDKSIVLLVNRLKESKLVEPVDAACSTDLEPVARSRSVRKSRLHGFEAPTAEEVDVFIESHGLDYALYSTHVGGDKPGGGVFLTSKWRVYDKEAKEVVSVLSRSVDASANRKTLTSSELADRFLSLFEENMKKFFSTANATSATRDRGISVPVRPGEASQGGMEYAMTL